MTAPSYNMIAHLELVSKYWIVADTRFVIWTVISSDISVGNHYGRATLHFVLDNLGQQFMRGTRVAS